MRTSGASICLENKRQVRRKADSHADTLQKVANELASIEEERSTVADTSGDAARLDKQREGLDVTLTDIHAKLSEMDSG